MYLKQIRLTLSLFSLIALLCLSLTFSPRVFAQENPQTPKVQVQLLAVMGDKASVIVNGGQPKMMQAGQTYQGIKLLSINGQTASFLVPDANSTKKINVRVGQSPSIINNEAATPTTPTKTQQPSKRYGELSFKRSRDGHFYATAEVNGQSIPFMIDTGATHTAVSLYQAKQMGLDYQQGEHIKINTANGAATAYSMTLNSITIQGTVVRNIPVTIIPGMSGEGLLGQSYLNKFRVSIKGDEMQLLLRP